MTVDAILEAAAELFAGMGYARTTTNRIADRAGVSIGSLYRYFPGKDATLARLLAVHHDDVRRVLERSLAELSDPGVELERGLRNMMHGLVALHHERPAITKALRADMRRGDHHAMAAVVGQAAGTLTRWLVHDAPAGLDPDTLLEETVQMLSGTSQPRLRPEWRRARPSRRLPPPIACGEAPQAPWNQDHAEADGRRARHGDEGGEHVDRLEEVVNGHLEHCKSERAEELERDALEEEHHDAAADQQPARRRPEAVERDSGGCDEHEDPDHLEDGADDLRDARLFSHGSPPRRPSAVSASRDRW
jgi:AcrR family transcriptional regulator